jgi:hypothetical protein
MIASEVGGTDSVSIGPCSAWWMRSARKDMKSSGWHAEDTPPSKTRRCDGSFDRWEQLSLRALRRLKLRGSSIQAKTGLVCATPP